MSAISAPLFVTSSRAPERRLPETQPLTLTRNFAWVFVFCVGSLVTVPLAIAWTASVFLN